ncbi:MAG: lipocalin-like domain-containing protein [Desulfuromonadales bacterium]|jgi:predicted secreted hydrolase
MKRRHPIFLSIACAVLWSAIYCQISMAVNDRPVGSKLSVEEVLGVEEDQPFARAMQPRKFVFPDDHGPHPHFKTEWWYYTGNLFSKSDRRFGYQLTFFRSALTPEAQQRNSNWATNQIYMAHFALTDVDAERFYHFERFSRDSLGLAGAKANPFKVWLENWSAEGRQGEPLTMRLSANEESVAIELNLESAKPIVLQGENGLSQKSAKPGNASYYYSMTRMPTSGIISISGESFQVSGTSWLDREWSTSALGEGQVGWDWFSLQFDDGRELMYYQLRLKDGTADPLSRGVLVDVDGSTKQLRPSDIVIKVLNHWQSSKSKAKYPAKWRLDVVNEGINLEISPVLAEQELITTVRYWEGAVSVQGKDGANKLTGFGYVELTGY